MTTTGPCTIGSERQQQSELNQADVAYLLGDENEKTDGWRSALRYYREASEKLEDLQQSGCDVRDRIARNEGALSRVESFVRRDVERERESAFDIYVSYLALLRTICPRNAAISDG